MANKNNSVVYAFGCFLIGLGSDRHISNADKSDQNTWANFALSRDGKVMAANYGGEIYRWTPNGGFVDLGPGDPNSSSIAISHDGSTIVSSLLGSNHAGTPGLWKQATG